MGVNKNISILMLFDCVRILVFIEAEIVKRVGGCICELMMVSMESRKSKLCIFLFFNFFEFLNFYIFVTSDTLPF